MPMRFLVDRASLQVFELVKENPRTFKVAPIAMGARGAGSTRMRDEMAGPFETIETAEMLTDAVRAARAAYQDALDAAQCVLATTADNRDRAVAGIFEVFAGKVGQ